MAKRSAQVAYPISLFSGLILLLWGVLRLIVFDPSTYSPSIATWHVITVPLLVLNCGALVVAYLLHEELERYSFKLSIRVVIGLLSAVLVLWLMNVGAEVFFGPILTG